MGECGRCRLPFRGRSLKRVQTGTHLIGMVGKIVKEDTGNGTCHVDFGKKIAQKNNRVNDTTHTFHEYELKLHKAGSKRKTPTHVVIWDEEDEDPHKFFPSEKEAKEFMKELEEKNRVVKDSIILVAIKSVQKVNITKMVRLASYKI